MSVCKDCIHYPVCIPYVSPNESFPEVEGGCTAFRDRGEFVDYRNIPYIKAEARVEVAEEIFGEIEATSSYSVDECNGRQIYSTKIYTISALKLAELKKKYTEGGENGTDGISS